MALVLKNPPANAGDIKNVGLIPMLKRSTGEGNGNTLQYFTWRAHEHVACWATVAHRVTELDTTAVN